jgi:hypothetical protein
MKSVSDFSGLAQFGIKTLTGESDALGFRILCDLDAQGVRVFKECFGLLYREDKDMAGMTPNWNSGSIASVLLTGHDIVPLAIIGFYLQGYMVVVTRYDDGQENVFALEKDDTLSLENLDTGYLYNGHTWPNCYGKIVRIIRQKASTRNVHQMTGRTL